MRAFSGTYHSKLDRGRCFFPAVLRKELPNEEKVYFKARVTENDEKYLEIYEDGDWKERVEALKSAIDYEAFDYEKEEILTDYLASAEIIEMEMNSPTNPTNNGRMLIPKKLLEAIGVKSEVTIVGSYGMLQIWDKDAFANRSGTGKSLKSRISELKNRV
ncbi:MAG: hypothetical protein LBR75_02140 [Prevotellaceae bacterium]|nr:hypothetical protein [Prevotellaceae bacterium]